MKLCLLAYEQGTAGQENAEFRPFGFDNPISTREVRSYRNREREAVRMPGVVDVTRHEVGCHTSDLQLYILVALLMI